MITEPLGLYVHIPFCLQKCAYCDFASFAGVDPSLRGKYLDALIKEIKCYKRREPLAVDSVFFGGGTPSLLSPMEINSILDAVRETFSLSERSEISMEINPGTVSLDKLSGYMACGVNRLSIGCQSIHDNELKILGRIHNSADFYKAFCDAREAGFDNINVDIMYGIPEQTKESFLDTLSKIIALSPEHISAYGLILEPGTRFFEKQNELNLPTEDCECEMYYSAADALCKSGYLHYEISNYAKQGYLCRHNLKYWRLSAYIGVGLAAHSFFEKKHFCKPSRFSEYFSLGEGEYISDGCLLREDEAYEYAMMRLRLAEGFSLDDYRVRFGEDFLCGREKQIKEYEQLDYLTVRDGRIALTERGFYVSNAILSELL